MKKLWLKKKTCTIPLNKKDIEIKTLGLYIEQKVSKGVSYTDISLPDTVNLFEIIAYILKKTVRNNYELICLTYYLSSFPKLKKSLDLKASLSVTNEALNKVSKFIQSEEFKENEIVFLDGEIGDKFYIIFQGEVSVLVPSEYEIKLTAEEYLDYLKRLIENKEYELFNLTINTNRPIYTSKQIVSLSSIAMNDTKVLRGTLPSIEHYIKRIEPNKQSNELLGLPFKIWQYHNMCQLIEGATFGDIALGYEKKKRTATIIASEHTFLGSLKKDIYQSSIKELIDKLRKSNIDFLLSNKLFKDINHDIFDRSYFNFFKLMSFTHLQNIFTQEDLRKEIYFIKSGEIEITINSSLNYLNIIIEILGGCSSKGLKSMVDDIPQMAKFCKQKKIFRVYEIGEKDVIGLEEYTIKNTNKFFCSAKVKSEKCEVFALEIPFFKKIFKSDLSMQINYFQDIAIRKQLMKERIRQLKEITIQFHFKNYHSMSKVIHNTTLRVSQPRLLEMTTHNISHRSRAMNNVRHSIQIKDNSIPLITTDYFSSQTKRTRNLKKSNETKVIFQESPNNEPSKHSYRSILFGSQLKNKVRESIGIEDKSIKTTKRSKSQKKQSKNQRLNLVDCLVLDYYIENITNKANRLKTPIKPIKNRKYIQSLNTESEMTIFI